MSSVAGPVPSAGQPPFSLVLGAGGRPGLAFNAGTLLALELHGLPAGSAVSVTGTSAGSIATALLAAGATAEDLAAHTAGATPRDEFAAMARLIETAESRRPRLDLGALWRSFDAHRPIAAAHHLRAGRMVAALATMVPGLVELTRRFDFLDAAAASPTFPTWRIVAVDTRGRRHVFTPDGAAPISLAVAASCAVPGLFAAVRHDGRQLVDGGVHSTTNADLAVGDDSGLVVVVAPMATTGPGRTAVDTTLDDEVATLESAGKEVVTFRPSPALRRIMGRNPLSGRRSRDITAAAFLEAADVLGQIHPRRPLAA